jgi:hypothetical protein
MSTMPDHLRPITVEIPVTWTAQQALAVYQMLDELREKISPVTAANCKICWPSSSDAHAGLASPDYLERIGFNAFDRGIRHRGSRFATEAKFGAGPVFIMGVSVPPG